MITLKRTDSDNKDFIQLVKALDADLAAYYKEEILFYDALNNIDFIKSAVVVYNENDDPIGCGGIKKYSQTEVEIKRMYVQSEYRGKGISSILLQELENWAKEQHYKKCVLETLKEKPYAIKFYEKNDYKETSNFGEYINAENSICFEKNL
ncbi:GNAT family N-acetyltransferase [Aurantibacter sp.]|uniref:GNAT family N-acetyltransferase n=1 Tax=Aurantibacter sp. TaxID=2807103 RepID=UPI0032653832